MRLNIKRTAVSAILTALCTTLIIVGSLLDILDLTVSAFCSFIIAAAVSEFGGSKYPILIYACSSFRLLSHTEKENRAHKKAVFKNYIVCAFLRFYVAVTVSYDTFLRAFKRADRNLCSAFRNG